MEHLKDDFLAGLLDIPDIICEEIPAVLPPTTKATKKRVALADVDTNVVEDEVNHQAKKKKITTSAVEGTEKKQKKTKTASKKTPAVILDFAEFDQEAQKTTLRDKMCKDVKRVLQTGVKMESTITDLREEIEDLAFQQTRMQAQIREYTRQQAAVSGNGDEQSLVAEPAVFLPPQLQESSPSQLFLAPETLPFRPSEPSSSLDTALLPIAIPPRNAKFAELPSAEIKREQLKSAPEVLQKYSSLRTECKSGALTVKLAREAIFGDSVLKRCTSRGWKDLPALPQTELNQLKAILYGQFPRFWCCPEQFERLWPTAQEVLAQAYKHLRRS